jgi:hypothetical protein
MAKNLCGKTRPVEQPYEVWEAGTGANMWQWKVLKKYQADDNKPYARAFCAVSSPITREQMSSGYELGDCYIADYASVATKVVDNVPSAA